MISFCYDSVFKKDKESSTFILQMRLRRSCDGLFGKFNDHSNSCRCGYATVVTDVMANLMTVLKKLVKGSRE